MPYIARNNKENVSQHQKKKYPQLKISTMTKGYATVVNQVVTAMLESVSLNSLLHSLTISLKEQLNLDNCLILLNNKLVTKTATKFTSACQSEEADQTLNYGLYLVKHYQDVLKAKQTVFLANPQEIAATGLEIDSEYHIWKSVIIVPIVDDQGYWGVIVLCYLYEQIKPDEIELNYLNILTNHCLLAMQKHQLLVEKTRVETINEKIVGGLDYTFHECRQPLSAILGLAKMLTEEIYGTLNPKQLEYIKAIMSSGDHLLCLTNDFLDLSKIDAEKEILSLERVLIEEVCQASQAMIYPALTSKNLSLHLEIESGISFCVADPMRLKQILVNLLSNAVKYTEEGSITLSVSQDKHNFLFRIIDTGIGISAENQQKLFQPFVQISNSHNRKQKGTGLGLVLSLKLAKLHGGDLTLESVENQGSCFTLSLPKLQKDLTSR